MCQSEKFFCAKCSQKQPSTKKLHIQVLPKVINVTLILFLNLLVPDNSVFIFQVLCLHLKRFRWKRQHRIKINSFVEFPLQDLNVRKYVLHQNNVSTVFVQYLSLISMLC